MASGHFSLWKPNRIHMRLHLLYSELDYIGPKCSIWHDAAKPLQVVVYATLLCDPIPSSHGTEDFYICEVSCLWRRNDFHNTGRDSDFRQYLSWNKRVAWQQSFDPLVQHEAVAWLNRVCYLCLRRYRCDSSSLGHHRRQRGLLQDHLHHLRIHYFALRFFFGVLPLCILWQVQS